MGRLKGEFYEWTKALLIAFALAFIIRFFFFSPIIVDGPSMQPTLHDRDRMIVNKFVYRYKEPERFDIVVFHASKQKDFIKRVIGLPGEHVAIKDDVLYINDQPIDEPHVTYETNELIQSNFRLESIPGQYDKIPEGHVLVLGDNRNHSMDSRRLGLVKIDQIVGKANLIYWPIDRWQIVK